MEGSKSASDKATETSTLIENIEFPRETPILSVHLILNNMRMEFQPAIEFEQKSSTWLNPASASEGETERTPGRSLAQPGATTSARERPESGSQVVRQDAKSMGDNYEMKHYVNLLQFVRDFWILGMLKERILSS